MRGAGRSGPWQPPAQTRRSGEAKHPGDCAGPIRGPAAAAMDIPPLAGKIAALSLGAIPVSYALNHVSVLSQCVLGGRGRRGWTGGCGGGWREDARAADLAPGEPSSRRALPPTAGVAREDGGWGQNPQPEVPFPPAESLFAGGRGVPGMFEA